MEETVELTRGGNSAGDVKQMAGSSAQIFLY